MSHWAVLDMFGGPYPTKNFVYYRNLFMEGQAQAEAVE